MSNPHSPEELAALSNFIHHLIGWLLLALALVRLRETMSGSFPGNWRFAWPYLGALIGFGLTVYIFVHQIFYHQVPPFSDSIQNQHQLIGLTVGLASVAEILFRKERFRSEVLGRLLEGAWPLGIIGVGVLFLLHEQGTFEALITHWALSATLILSGLASLSAILSREDAKAVRIFAVLLIGAAAIQLIAYEEKPGAHGAHGAHANPVGHEDAH